MSEILTTSDTVSPVSSRDTEEPGTGHTAASSGEEGNLFEEARKHYDDIYRIALLLCRDEDLAFDLTQETYRNTFSAVQGGSRIRNIMGYLTISLRNAFYKHLRKKREVASGYDPERIFGHISDISEPKEIFLITPGDIQREVGLLDVKYRLPVILYYYDECSYAEIAERLDLPVGTVMSRLSRGKRRLKKKLAGM